MRSTRSTSRRLVAGTAGLAAALATLAFVSPASANSTAAGLKINEVYGGGGNSGATFNADFIELKNTSGATVSLGGLSLQYRSATSVAAATNLFSLPSVDVPAGDTYLVAGAGGANGAALPTPDATSTLNLSGTAGQIYIATTTTGINPGAAGNISNSQVVDFVGYGTTAVSYEGAAPAPAPANPSSLTRTAGTDTNVNSADFKLLNPATAPTPCGSACPATPPPPPVAKTIAEIQGTDTDTSPVVGANVITEGVVTASYPAGGFYGYVIQTDGTGSGADATPGASDAVYVHQPSGSVTAKIGDLVQVTGIVSEYQGLTELTVPETNLVDEGSAPIGVTPLSIAYPTTDAGREAHESELLDPTNEFTVTDNYSTNQYGEIGLATGDHQLRVPTDIANPNTDPAGVAAVIADNAARGVVLDDGASINFLSAANQNIPLPWLSTDNPVRIGSTATLRKPVILDYRNGGWKFQPTRQVTGDGRTVAAFSDTRTENLAPQPVGGNLKLGTFNVLNYFNTTGQDWIDSGHTCTFYKDRNGDPVTDNNCSDNGPRGAAESSGGTDLFSPKADLERQRVKEVKAINTMDADIVSLEEIENSVALGETDRDDALKSLVDALNADPNKPHPWAFVPSPSAADLPPTAEQDVIRTAFIYNPDKVDLVGVSKVLSDQSGPGQPFENAREPLAQEFKRKGATDSDGFAVIVNHFKSKGSGVDDGTGQGNSNPDRIAQAHALVTFADAFKESRGTDKVFLVGDFNSYTQEDPMQVLYGAGYINQASDHPNDSTYEFGGQTGSLDHVLANSAGAGIVTGRDVWQIDAEESVGFEYSRYDYNATLLYQPNQFRASDHNPEIVGLNAPSTPPQKSATTTVVSPVRFTYGHKGIARVTVSSASGAVPIGVVTLRAGGRTVGTGTLDAAGRTRITINGKVLKPGRYTLAAEYAGDGTHQASTGTAVLRVRKATPRVKVSTRPHTARAHRTRVLLRIRVTAHRQTVHGKVKVRTGGHVYRTKLVHGKATVRLKTFGRTGNQNVVVRYLGDRYNHAVEKVTHIRVHR